MKKMCLKSAVLALTLIPLVAQSQSPGETWHRNVALISRWAGYPGRDPIIAGGVGLRDWTHQWPNGQTKRYLLVGLMQVSIIDVTDPKNPFEVSYIHNTFRWYNPVTKDNSIQAPFADVEIFEPKSSTGQSDSAFAYLACGGLLGPGAPTPEEALKEDSAKFAVIVIRLYNNSLSTDSSAIDQNATATSGHRDIAINPYDYGNYKLNGASTSIPGVYTGRIVLRALCRELIPGTADSTYVFWTSAHTITKDPRGILFPACLSPYIDAWDLRIHPEFPRTNGNVTHPDHPEVDNTGDHIALIAMDDCSVTTDGNGNRVAGTAKAHELEVYPNGDGSTTIYVAALEQGIRKLTLDYSFDATTQTWSASIPNMTTLKYQSDRCAPTTVEASSSSPTDFHDCHTAHPIWAGGKEYILTEDEIEPDYNMSAPKQTVIGCDGNNTTYQITVSGGDPDLNGGRGSPLRNNSRIGNFLRVFDLSATGNARLVGGCYDVPEGSERGTTSLAQVAISPDDNEHAMNVQHRLSSCKRNLLGSDHVMGYVSGYSQGFRVVDFSDPASPVEVGWFDNFPTLNDDPVSARYYRNDILNSVRDGTDHYFVVDTHPDTSGDASRERLVYSNVVGPIGNGQGAALTFRSYYKTLGGNGDNELYACPTFPYINLAGDFKLLDDVSIASGTTVTLLPGTTTAPTQLLKDTWNNYRTITVNSGATLIIKTANGGLAPTAGGDIVSCNLHVLNGGHLVIESGADARLDGNVTIDQTGTWAIHAGATMRLRYNAHYGCHGEFTAIGTSSSRARILCCDHFEWYPTIMVGQEAPLDPFSGSARIDWADIEAVQIEAVHLPSPSMMAPNFIITNTMFVSGSTNSSDGKFRSVIIYKDTKGAVDHCSFAGPGWTAHWLSDRGIEIHDVLLQPVLLSNNQFGGYNYGIYSDGSRVEASGNIFDNALPGGYCRAGFYITGSKVPARVQRYHDNHYFGDPNAECYGVQVENGAEPYLLSNDLSNGAGGVVSWSWGVPTLACNQIHDNRFGVVSEFGTAAGSKFNMQWPSWMGSLHPARNHVWDNIVGNVWEPENVSLDLGQNFIQRIAPGRATLLLGMSTTNVLPPGFVATNNYWGIPNPTPQCGPPYNAGNWWNPTWTFPPLPAAPPGCVNYATSVPSDACPYWAQYIAEQSGFFGSPCDSLIALYDERLACGNCDSAIATLEQAIMLCGNKDDGTLRDLLTQLLTETTACHGRDHNVLAGLLGWYGAYAGMAPTPGLQHAATWLQGQTLSVMQCFDSAAIQFSNIAQAHWAAPEDSAAASEYAGMMNELSSVEGNSTDCGSGFGKESANQAEYRGRIGDATPADPLLMQVYPNPFTNETEIVFTMPEDDRVEVRVYNQAAQDVTTLMSETSVKGRHTVRFAAAGLAPGVYYVAVHTSNFQECKSIVLKK
jgi:hypothetical protein